MRTINDILTDIYIHIMRLLAQMAGHRQYSSCVTSLETPKKIVKTIRSKTRRVRRWDKSRGKLRTESVNLTKEVEFK